MKPSLDTRFGKDIVRSRAGLEMESDYSLDPDDEIDGVIDLNADCVVVDEAQFLTVKQIEDLRKVATELGIPVICYGLRADFRTHLFPASKRLFELADSIEEVKNVCHYCNRKSTMNLKHVDGVATREGPSVELGAEEKYFPVCFTCYEEAFSE